MIKNFFSKSKIYLRSNGFCTTCDNEVIFEARNSWLRDHFICKKCGSIPRERALMLVLEKYYPNWRELTIHETSPVNRGASKKISKSCRNYIPSQYFLEYNLGEIIKGTRCEDIEKLTFPEESIDLHISQDVLEHIFNPAKAFSEIARTLKPGGAHIFTVPLVRKMEKTITRARKNNDGSVDYLESPQYHGNPISKDGSLVTIDWGYDICQYIFKHSGLFTQIIHIDELSKGIRAEFIEVLVTIKPKQDLEIF
jgi:SAM-dependent methyltransferase